jgi:hypothetical protein
MFAGGYDLNKDTRGSVGTDDSEGNALFVVDAVTGSLIWKARRGAGGAGGKVFEHPRLTDSIPSTLTVADTDGDGFTDRIEMETVSSRIRRAPRWRQFRDGRRPAFLPPARPGAEQGRLRAVRRRRRRVRQPCEPSGLRCSTASSSDPATVRTLWTPAESHPITCT